MAVSPDILAFASSSSHVYAMSPARGAIPRLVVCAIFVALPMSALRAAQPAVDDGFLRRHCVDCHAGVDAAGGLALDRLGRDLQQADLLAKWVGIYDRVDRGEMPPRDQPQPTAAERSAFLTPLRETLIQASRARAHTVLRRLNRTEYERTVNDLLGTAEDLVELLPEDGRAAGFDKLGEALDLSPVQMQACMVAAGRALDACISGGTKPESSLVAYQLADGRNQEFVGPYWLKRPDGTVVIFLSQGPPITPSDSRTKIEGRYRFRIHAAAYQSTEPMTYGVFLGPDTIDKPSKLFGYFDVLPGEPQPVEFEAYMKKRDTLRLRLQVDTSQVSRRGGVEKFTIPGLAVAKIEVEGPLIDEWPSRGHRLRFGDLLAEDRLASQRKQPGYKPQWVLRSKQPEADVERLLPGFVTAAFRRPVAAEEIQPFIDLAKQELAEGTTFEQALRTAHVTVLCSPEFLFLREPAGKLDDYAVAARLSFMLWNTGPDARLLKRAAEGTLSQSAVLRAETDRLLKDPRSRRFITDFVGQWLNLREIDSTTPDRQLYPEFDSLLQQAMVDETEGFFDEVLRKNLSLLNFIDSDWTILNERLAKHYGISGVDGVAMRRVALRPEDHRGGVLTHGSVLKVSANGTTTSPVVRGAWVLRQILGFDPPPPPPGVPGIEPDIRGATTLRELLDRHRSNAACVHCHKVIDPPGFALESYDVAGRYRKHYRVLGSEFPAPARELSDGKSVKWRVGPPVNSAGETADGRAFADLAEYKRMLLADPAVIARALAVKLAVYGTGRAMEFSDREEVDKIVRASAAQGYGFRDLLHLVVQSNLFLNK
jgi:hypothetical protein